MSDTVSSACEQCRFHYKRVQRCALPEGVDGLVSVLGQVCKSHPVVGEDGMNLVGEGFDHAAQEICAIHLSHIVPELYIGELGNPVNGQEHVELALVQAQLGNVNVHVANFSWRKLAPSGGFDVAGWQP